MDEPTGSPKADRAYLVGRIGAWQQQLPPPGVSVGTLGHGMLDKAEKYVGALIEGAVRVLTPENGLHQKATLGPTVKELAKHGPKHSLECLGRERPVVTTDDIETLDRFVAWRNAFAHPDEETLQRWRRIGGPSSDEIRDFIDLVEEIVSLPVVDELICREQAGSTVADTDR